MVFDYCPRCREKLTTNPDGYRACGCGFVHYDNPTPVVAIVVPMMHLFLDFMKTDTSGILDGGLVLVRRGQPPFVGKWCLPCGHIEQFGHPKAEGARETHEECGLTVRMEKLLCICNPMPVEINQIVISYLARPVGGILRAGDDASAVGVFTPENRPDICFRSHRMLFDRWFEGSLGTLTGNDLVI